MWCALPGTTPALRYRTGATRALDVTWEGPGVAFAILHRHLQGQHLKIVEFSDINLFSDIG